MSAGTMRLLRTENVVPILNEEIGCEDRFVLGIGAIRR